MGVKLIGKWNFPSLPCSYNFLPDGSGYYSFMGGKKEFSYMDNSDSVTIHFTGDALPNTFKYVIKEDILSIQDSFGDYVKYKKAQE